MVQRRLRRIHSIGRVALAVLAAMALTLVAGPSAGAAAPRGPIARALTSSHQPVGNAEAVIEGEVLANFDPAGDATRVDVFDAVTRRRLASAYVPGGEAHYRIGGLPARPVKVRAVALTGLWMPSWADGATSWASARTFVLHPGEHLTQSWDPVALYLDLGYASELSGTVTGSGRPIGHSRVTVLDLSGGVLATTRTDATGRYCLRFSDWSGLQVKVRATKPGWKAAYANGQDSFETATVIDVPPQTHVVVGSLVLKR